MAEGRASSTHNTITLTITLDSGTGKGIRWFLRRAVDSAATEYYWQLTSSSSNVYSYTYTGLTSSTTYVVSADIYWSNGSSNRSQWTFIEGQTSTIPTEPAPGGTNTPPGGTTGISAFAVKQRSPKLMNVYWNTVDRATGYRLYKSSDGGSSWVPVLGSDGQVGDTTSYQVEVDYEWQYYRFRVIATNQYGNGPAVDLTSPGVKSNDSYEPVLNEFYATDIKQTEITVTAQANDTVPDAGSMSGISYIRFTMNGTNYDMGVDGTGRAYKTFSGLNTNTTYTITAYAMDAGGNASGTTTINPTTLAGAGGTFPPSGALNLNGSITGLSVSLSWSAIAGNNGGITRYEVYKRQAGTGSWYAAISPNETTSTSASFGVDLYNTSYEFLVKSKNNIGYGTEATITRVSGGVPSNVPSWGDQVGQSVFMYSANNPPDQMTYVMYSGNGSPTYKVFANDGTQPGDGFLKYSGPWGSHLITLDRPGVNYTIRIRCCNENGCSLDYCEGTFKWGSSPRPSNWSWTYSIAAGQPTTNLTASDWNTFCDRINEFRSYKGLPPLSFTDAPYGDGSIFAFMFNQALAGIRGNGTYAAIPGRSGITRTSDVSTGETILASDLNNMKDDLNSTV